jgi:hypothetical protein
MTYSNIIRHCLSRPIAFHRIFVDIAGGVAEGLFLSQLYYWMPRAKHDYIYKTFAEWRQEIGITRREFESARKTLKRKGLLTEKQQGMDRKLWFKLDVNALDNLIVQISTDESEMVSTIEKTEMSDCTDGNVQSATSKCQIVQMEMLNLPSDLYTETTSEINSDIFKGETQKEEESNLESLPQYPSEDNPDQYSPVNPQKSLETTQGSTNTSEQTDYGAPCNTNVESAKDNQKPKRSKGDAYFNNNQRREYRRKQQSGEFRDKPPVEKIGIVYAAQAKEWGKTYEEVKDGFEAFILTYAVEKDKPTPQQYVSYIAAKTFNNPEEAQKSYLWQEYIKTYKPPATEPTEASYFSCATVFKTYGKTNFSYAKEFIEKSVSHLGWTFKNWIDYAQSKGHFASYTYQEN